VIVVCDLLFETIAFRVTVDAELPIEWPVKEKQGDSSMVGKYQSQQKKKKKKKRFMEIWVGEDATV
jgi:hypothetical protein